MASHLRYKRTVVSPERQEDYFRESAEIAGGWGLGISLRHRRRWRSYLEAMRPRLRCDERTREVAQVLLSTRLPGRMSQPVGRVMMNAGIDLLPEWAREMLGLSLTPLQRRTTRLMVHGVARVLRASVRNGAWHCAMRRMTEA